MFGRAGACVRRRLVRSVEAPLVLGLIGGHAARAREGRLLVFASGSGGVSV